MNKKLIILLIVSLSVLPFAGCSKTKAFTQSTGIDKNGFWEGIKALDYVDLCDYSNINIPIDVGVVSEEEIQDEIGYYLSEHSITNKITNRPVKDGETVNIDYVGSVDGVEFEGGSTKGAGAEVIIGYTSYIDDFLDQLIGHMPGTTFNVEVTFPEDYGSEEAGNANLNGKDAIFVTTINHIVEYSDPVLTDAFVMEKLSPDYGWTTIEEMRQGVTDQVRSSKLAEFIPDYIAENSTVKTLPESMMTYQENSLLLYYKGYAKEVGMEFPEFLTAYLGVATEAELLEMSKDESKHAAEYNLLVQAIAEDAGITVTDKDVSDYFLKYMQTDDYSEYETFYGMPYLKWSVLIQLVLDHIEANATFG